MKVILSQQCLSLVGTLERGLGYHLVRRKNGFFSRRDSKGFVPSDGHWLFIVLCAEMAQNGLYINDIEVTGYELKAALLEACFLQSAYAVDVDEIYSAEDVLKLKTTLGL